MPKNNRPTAAVIIIGNDILSGRTQDTNLNYIARRLSEIGIIFAEARVIPDIEDVIINTINEMRVKYDYIFTTGGIGPTHDDITSLAVAKAFSVNLVLNKEAVHRLENQCGGKNGGLNEAQLKMAYIPEGASLIGNAITAAPGFHIGNVFVMAGIPVIMRDMFENLASELVGGTPMLSRTVTTDIPEGNLATDLSTLQNTYPEVEIGSYPSIKGHKFGVSIVMRSENEKLLAKVEKEARKLILKCGGNLIKE